MQRTAVWLGEVREKEREPTGSGTQRVLLCIRGKPWGWSSAPEGPRGCTGKKSEGSAAWEESRAPSIVSNQRDFE